MIKVMTLFGTRPEAIKMAPLVKLLERDADIDSVVCITGQHREMTDQMLELFGVVPQYDLDIMKHGQTLSEITARILLEVEAIIEKERPDLVLVHGDPNSALAGALSAFYAEVPVGHVEAGLRTGNLRSPFPEEANRVLIARIATLHFAATQGNVDNLLSEGVDRRAIFKTGNTVIDALQSVADPAYVFQTPELKAIDFQNRRVLLLTAHRRENQGDAMEAIFRAIRDIVDAYADVELIFPIHKNPAVRRVAMPYFQNHPRVHVIEPLGYQEFVNLQARCHLILTDSGGMQEEAPALGKPVVVLRTETERPEAVDAGTVVIAGVSYEGVYRCTARLLSEPAVYRQMSEAVNPYGDGHACGRIVDAIKDWHKNC